MSARGVTCNTPHYPRGLAFCSGCGTPDQRAALGVLPRKFRVSGTAGLYEGYFGGRYGLNRHLLEVGGRLVQFEGSHAGECEVTMEVVAQIIQWV